MELTVHAPSRLKGQDRYLLVQSAAHRLVVHLRLLRDSVLKCRAGARVGAVHCRQVVVMKPDDVPEGGVAVHSLGSVPACGHVGADDVRELVVPDEPKCSRDDQENKITFEGRFRPRCDLSKVPLK